MDALQQSRQEVHTKSRISSILVRRRVSKQSEQMSQVVQDISDKGNGII